MLENIYYVFNPVIKNFCKGLIAEMITKGTMYDCCEWFAHLQAIQIIIQKRSNQEMHCSIRIRRFVFKGSVWDISIQRTELEIITL
jgi:hypothetical protein